MSAYLLASAGQVAVLMTAGLAVAAALHGRSAALRHWVLSAALLSAACLPALHAIAPRCDVGRWLAPGAARLADAPGLPGPHAAAVPPSVTGNAVAVSVAASREDRAPTALPRLLLFGWALGAGVAFLVLAAGLGRLRWLASRARPLDDALWTRIAGDVSRREGLRRAVTLLHSNHPALLAAWGWRAPVVLVPRSATTWSREDVEIVLRHELAHIARGDWLLQLLAETVRALNWFNPLVWIAARRLRAESERACDDAVLRYGVAGPDYAERLVGLAKRLDTGRRWKSLFPAPAMARPSSLERRVAAMLNARVDRAPLTASGRAAILCLALGLGVPVAGLAVFAQAPGTFTGSVLDPAGRRMDARVKLVNTASGINAEVRTGKVGTFEFSGLAGGQYTIEVSQPGFATLKTTITMANAGMKRDFSLQLGSITESVHVRVPGDETASPAQTAAPGRPPSARTKPCTADPVAGGNIEAPRKLRDAKPDYPASLKAEKVTGDVMLEGVVGKDGAVHDLRVVEAPHPDLGRAMTDAVSRWQFEPTLLNCEPVEVKITVKARFEQ